jgi:hypothetical protein
MGKGVKAKKKIDNLKLKKKLKYHHYGNLYWLQI